MLFWVVFVAFSLVEWDGCVVGLVGLMGLMGVVLSRLRGGCGVA